MDSYRIVHTGLENISKGQNKSLKTEKKTLSYTARTYK